jgi:putative endonuclease
MPRRGGDAERRAANHYRLRGYRILARNAWAAGYELDLVARRGRRVVVAEVKEKVGDGFGDPLEMIDDEKQRRVVRAAEAWLARRPDLAGLDVTLEAVAVRPDGIRRVPFGEPRARRVSARR